MHARMTVSIALAIALGGTVSANTGMDIWRDGETRCRLVLPTGDDRGASLARSTLTDYARQLGNIELEPASDASRPGNYIVIGRPETNPLMSKLVSRGATLTNFDLGEEGFQLLTHQDANSRYVLVHGRTPRAIKHACQELMYYRTSATTTRVAIDWPLDVVMKPAIGYRGIYILPCWSAYDSLDSWKRMLRFNSELTINRNWFWLGGFPVAGHTGEYGGTALADEKNVQALIDLSNSEEMAFLIGDGWFTFHHRKAVGDDYAKGRDYFLAYLRTFKNIRGLYLEPTGEGKETGNWRPECDALRDLIRTVLKDRPEMEIALAIGKFNNNEYLKLMSELDSKRVHWWWCWGDPYRDKAFDFYPTILRWHTIVRMSNFHGSNDPPLPSEATLAGVVTSYDPGQGFGNPWNGWAKLGVTEPRNFDPYEIPYFGHEYHYRERCWDLRLSDADFVKRLHRRLFDADAPRDAGEQYWRLTQITMKTGKDFVPSPEQLAPIKAFVEGFQARKHTPRTTDTIKRMEFALGQLGRLARTPDKK